MGKQIAVTTDRGRMYVPAIWAGKVFALTPPVTVESELDKSSDKACKVVCTVTFARTGSVITHIPTGLAVVHEHHFGAFTEDRPTRAEMRAFARKLDREFRSAPNAETDDVKTAHDALRAAGLVDRIKKAIEETKRGVTLDAVA